MTSAQREGFDRDMASYVSSYRHLKSIGMTNALQSYLMESQAEIWNYRPDRMTAKFASNQAVYNVDVRIGIDLSTMFFTFGYKFPWKNTRITQATSLSNPELGMTSDLFHSSVGEKDLYTGLQLVAAAGTGDEDLTLQRMYILHPENMIEYIEFNLNNTPVGRIPQQGSQLTFAEYLTVHTVLFGSGKLPGPASTNDLLPNSKERFQVWKFMNNILEYDLITNPLIQSDGGTSGQCTINVGKLAAGLGLPEKYLTGTTLTVTVRFLTNSTDFINAAVYVNPSLGMRGRTTNTDMQVISDGDNVMAINDDTTLTFDRLNDNRAIVTRNINSLLNINGPHNVYSSPYWNGRVRRNIAQGETYSENVSSNQGVRPKFLLAFFTYNPTTVPSNNYVNGLFTPRGITLYQPPHGTKLSITVTGANFQETLNNISFDYQANSDAREIMQTLKTSRIASFNRGITNFVGWQNFYPIIALPVTKSEADINRLTDQSLTNGVITFELTTTGTQAYDNNIDLHFLVVSERFQIRPNTQIGVHRVGQMDVASNGFLQAGVPFGDQIRRNVALKNGITAASLG